MKKFIPLLGFLFIVFLISGISSSITMPAVQGWYKTINKSVLNPPDWIFAPVWTTLYIMIAISGWLVWNKLGDDFYKKASSPQIKIYSLQLLANFIWSIIFFGMQNPKAAFAEILLLLTLIILNIRSFRKISKTASYLLIPYLLWVSFATYLNGTIAILN